MFPSLNVSFKDLDPSQNYCVFLELVNVENCRFKYSGTAGWSPGGQAEHQSERRMYLHPESPSTGNYWLNQSINFHRVKLTNTTSPPEGQMVLNSMHKYQPRIIILQSENPQALHWAPSKVIDFKETAFIAVTAYQNDKVTKMKIHYNPFAKGFRENGKCSSKRKQHYIEETNEANEKHLKKRNTTPSPPLSTPSVSPPAIYTSYPISSERFSMPPLLHSYYHSPQPFPSFSMYNQFLSPYPLYYPYLCAPKNYSISSNNDEPVVSKKFTNFSIRTLINID